MGMTHITSTGLQVRILEHGRYIHKVQDDEGNVFWWGKKLLRVIR